MTLSSLFKAGDPFLALHDGQTFDSLFTTDRHWRPFPSLPSPI